MKSYLITTGVIFALVTFLHIVRAIQEMDMLPSRPSEFIFMSALTLLTAFLSVWAWRLLRRLPQS